ncbi:MAG TPA: FlgD immunoglobulin-like domain containing protein [Thermoleophilia bacterium]|nr:FlgD immunoglobulin-like domain containing protein [Thermoleophilia bacterium]
MARPRPHKRAARLAAIFTLSVLGAVAAVWAAPRVSGAVEAWMSTPPVELRTTNLGAALPVVPETGATGVTGGRAAAAAGDGSVATDPAASGDTLAPAAPAAAATVDAGMRFTMAGVRCAPPARAGEVRVRLRTSEDGRSWSAWYAVTLERVAEEGGEELAFTEPIWTGGGRYLQVVAEAGGGDEPVPVRLRDVRVVTINSTEDADRTAVAVGVLRRAAAAVAGLRLTPDAAAMTTKPKIVTRAAWGANESWRSGSPDYAAVKMAFVHHTASSNGYTAAEAPAVVRGVYAYHTRSLHWSDIGYNFLIDRYGTIYEGRYGGVARGVVGAQVLGFNTGSTGISVLGTFSDSTPPSRTVTALERLLEWKLDVHHIDPLGTGTLRCAYGQKYATGQRVTFPAIAGHRDANYTDCPGGRLYAQLPTVRRVVARTGQPKIYGFIVADPSISPNGDGVRDRTTVGFTVSQSASWTVTIRDDAGQPVRNLSGEGTEVETTWAGHDDTGAALPDGVYTLQADATSAAGVARPATATLRLDTVTPRIESAVIEPDPFSPNGDGQADVTRLAFVPGESGTARVSVLGAGDAVLRRVTGWTSVMAAVRRVTWDGRVSSGSALEPAPEGEATLLLELRDGAGNTTSARRKVTLDRTLARRSVSRTTFSPNGDGVHDGVTLSFRLTRAAEVTVTVVRQGSTMRTMRLGRLGAGNHSVTWDGKLGGGGTAASGAYSLKLTATGALGSTSVVQPLTVDLSPPRLTAPATASVRYGRTAKIAYTVRDAFSPKVKVSATVTDARGRTVATLALGWVKQGVAQVCAWKPRARRTYTVTFKALDLGGNRQAKPAVTSLRVR